MGGITRGLLVGPGTPERHIFLALEELRACGWSPQQIEIGCQPPLTPSEIASAARPALTWEVPPGPDAVPLLEELNTRQAQLSACLRHGSGPFILSAGVGIDGVLRQVVATPKRAKEPESCTEYDQEMGRCTREISGADPHYDPVEIACLEYYFRGFRFSVDEFEDAEPRRITFQLEGEETSN